MSDLLAIESISVAYGKRLALDGVSLTVAAGEIVTLLGANGSGKSTTLRTISGLVRPARGRVVFDGRDITRAAPDAIVAGGVAHVPEGREIFPQFTVYENLLTGGFTTSPAAVRDGIERAFALFPVLRGRARQRAGTLSGGEQQMLAIGRALMTNPRLLVLDEATEGLAPVIRQEIWQRLTILKGLGLSMLIIDKELEALSAFADHHYVIEKGEVVWSGSTDALRRDTDFMSELLAV